MKMFIILFSFLLACASCSFSPKAEKISITGDTIIIFRTQTTEPLMHYAPLKDGGSCLHVDSLFENGRYASKEFLFSGLYSEIDSVINRLGVKKTLRNASEKYDKNTNRTDPLIYALQLKLRGKRESFCIIQWCKPLEGDYTLRIKDSYPANETSLIVIIEAEFANGYKKDYRYQILGFYPDDENPYL